MVAYVRTGLKMEDCKQLRLVKIIKELNTFRRGCVKMRRAVRRRIEGFMMMDVRFYSLGKKVKGC